MMCVRVVLYGWEGGMSEESIDRSINQLPWRWGGASVHVQEPWAGRVCWMAPARGRGEGSSPLLLVLGGWLKPRRLAAAACFQVLVGPCMTHGRKGLGCGGTAAAHLCLCISSVKEQSCVVPLLFLLRRSSLLLPRSQWWRAGLRANPTPARGFRSMQSLFGRESILERARVRRCWGRRKGEKGMGALPWGLAAAVEQPECPLCSFAPFVPSRPPARRRPIWTIKMKSINLTRLWTQQTTARAVSHAFCLFGRLAPLRVVNRDGDFATPSRHRWREERGHTPTH